MMIGVTEPLGYRDGHEGDVDPVLIDGRGDGSVRIVVTPPPAARLRARNRFLITAGIAVALVLTALVARSGNPVFAFGGSFSFIAVAASIVMGLLWLQSGARYVFETNARELCLEVQGRLGTRRRCFPRQCVRDIQVATNLHGRPVALVIKATHQKLGGRYFEYLDAQCIEQVAAALREGLGLTPPVGAE